MYQTITPYQLITTLPRVTTNRTLTNSSKPIEIIQDILRKREKFWKLWTLTV